MKTDLELKKDVFEELEWEPSVNASEIGVIVKDGVVTLTGSVDHYPEKWEAEHAAIVALELGIPAVIGCGDATMRLKTGDRVRVDGRQGVVEILKHS